MKTTFDPFCEQQLFPHEGGYVDHPRDPGGATNMGITLATLSRARGRTVTKAEVRSLTKDEALRIYRQDYWNKTGPIGGDAMLAGPDAALFDVAVNSGVGRAKQWYPLTVGKNAVDATKAICARRRSFFQSLSTFSVFGKGWMRRVNSVEAWCLIWAAKAQGIDAGPVLKTEAAKSKTTSKTSAGGAAATTGGTGTATQTEAAHSADWTMIAAVGIPLAILLAFLIYQAIAHSARAKAMEGASDGLV